jgi:hypothetical protein
MDFWLALSEIIRNAGIVVAGALGLLLAWWRVRAADRQAKAALEQADASLQQAKLARRDHVTELFNRAASQLDDPKLAVRLGAIYVLREIGRDFPDLSQPVFELLAAHLRERPLGYGDEEPPVDVVEIMAMLRDKLRG